ncbi:hypothetical protein [Paenibacillus sp. MMS20-IR301]|uniref:hypothetical protein n=1 Tax=Paenibacillus sp. MMS20-IR301 TaxID=2895946 RepID=UPI0028E6DCD1|nr:hypothetical protein [Paenibacillus sp. MMS20-IR301]WNS43280.1 hypothetical protein LOS79_30805 [Paenibacillus sp. MMS20-IR301]
MKIAKKNEQAAQATKAAVKKDPVPVKPAASGKGSTSVINKVATGAKNLGVGTYNLLVGDDIKGAFGKNSTTTERWIGSASLAFTVVTLGEGALIKGGIKVAAQGLEKAVAKNLVVKATVKETAEVVGNKVTRQGIRETITGTGRQAAQEAMSEANLGTKGLPKKQNSGSGLSSPGSSKPTQGAPEPEVQNFIEKFKQEYPNREFDSGHKRQHSDGRDIEIDFETDNSILEFKAGNGNGLTRQVTDRLDSVLNPQGKVVIGVPGLKMSKHAAQSVEKAGGLMTNDIKSLLELIKP